MRSPGALLASGRDCDIFDYGPGLVLRRSRAERSLAMEARTMEYARELGYPVPAVEELSDDGTAMVLERVDGPSMVEALQRRPWAVRRMGVVLAGLHRDLHELPAPPWLPAAPCGDGDRLLHLDLHPLNVLMAPGGPVVIDWTGAARGPAGVDVALAWALLAAGQVPGGRLVGAVLGLGRGLLLGGFLAGSPRDEAAACLPEVVDWKCRDPHMSAGEQAAMRRLAARIGASASGDG